MLVGVMVTGAGPHAGDAATPRNGLDIELLEHLHSYPAYLWLALAVFIAFVIVRADKDKELKLPGSISLWLVIALSIQAVIGVAQARLGVPPLLVGLHMLGASCLVSLVTFQFLALRVK